MQLTCQRRRRLRKLLNKDTCAWNFQSPINQNFCYKYTVVTKEHHSELIKRAADKHRWVFNAKTVIINARSQAPEVLLNQAVVEVCWLYFGRLNGWRWNECKEIWRNHYGNSNEVIRELRTKKTRTNTKRSLGASAYSHFGCYWTDSLVKTGFLKKKLKCF